VNHGLYAAYLGMRARQNALDTIANNLANSSTTGFKADRLVYRSVEAQELAARERAARESGAAGAAGLQTSPPNPAGPANPALAAPGQVDGTPAAGEVSQTASGTRQNRALGVVASGATDFGAGALRQTGAPLDLALEGDGFFVVQTARGERYTRAGSFALNADGQLVTHRGDLVVGERGPVTVPPGEIGVGEDGTVSVSGRAVERLRIVRFNSPSAALTKEGDSLFAANGSERPTEANNARVLQGSLESSNVNPLAELSAMIENSREFDSLQRSVTLLMNDLGRKIAGEIGRI
jgi:flagellar basal-body rod protein FlgF